MPRLVPRTLALIALMTLPALAHHTYVTKYDASRTVRISGVVTSVSFVNPHIFFSVQAGNTIWLVETESLSVASAKGLTQELLKDGAKVTVTGWPARDGSAQMGLNVISIDGGPTITMRGTAR